MPRYDRIYLPSVSTVDALRQSVDGAFGKLVSQLNQNVVCDDFSMNGHRVTNVSWPAEYHDAVNVEYLKNALANLHIDHPSDATNTSGGGYDKVVFGCGVNVDLAVGTNLNPPYWMLCRKVRLKEVVAGVKVAATGADVVFALNKNGTSIKATNFTIPANSTSYVSWTAGFDTTSFVAHDLLTIDVVQVGATTPGQTLVVEMKFEILAV